MVVTMRSPSAITPGYVLAQGRLASALPLVRVSLRTLTAVLAELRATADWAAICREYHGAGAAR